MLAELVLEDTAAASTAKVTRSGLLDEVLDEVLVAVVLVGTARGTGAEE